MNEDTQDSLLLMQAYQERMDAIFQQVQLIEDLMGEYRSAQNALEEIAKTGKGEDILVPIGGSVFLRASILDTERVLAGVGGGAVTEKSVSSAMDFLDKRIREMQAQEEKLIQMSQDIRGRVEQLNQKLRAQQDTE
ncbi:MAG: prefoldin subunit alpha [Candidatus Thermoplasmatota archaeon]|nr:prefoldin subunit alpha [Candidatus Thermoplasmatota archaeon]MDD5778116.1 prefoldin subunit alpha [Candidatus Thermoplasmatota archaeon]